MDDQRFQAMVARLERESALAPRRYQMKVGLLALLGFALLLLVMGLAGLGVLLLVGLVALVVVKGGAAALLLAKLGKAVVVLAVGLWFLLKTAFQTLFVRLPAPQGLPLTRAQAPALFEAMDHLRQRMRGPRFHQVLLIDEVNAAVVQRPLFGLIGFPRNHLLLGLPLLESMTPDEALAVVAHEYGHLAGAHSRFGAFIYRLRWSWGRIDELAAGWQGVLGRSLGRLVRWYAPYFNAYTFVLARAHEHQADRAAAELVGVSAAAGALKRVNLAGPLREGFMDGVFQRLAHQPTPPDDVAQRWAEVASQPLAEADARRWLGQALDRAPQALDTHPTLRARLQALDPASPPEQEELPAPPAGPTAAQAWLGACLPAVREHFQRAWAERLAEPWAERHQALQVQQARLAQLRTLPAPNEAEAFESLQLQVQLEDAAQALPALAAFCDAHPNHAQAAWLRACVCLDLGDEAGLAFIEQVMALDPEAIKPACERAHRFLMARQDIQRASAYEARWQARHRFEAERVAQLGQLAADHRLLAPEFDAATLAQLQVLARGLQRKGVRRLSLVRRVLPVDAAVQTHVLGVDLGWWARWRGHHQAIVERLAQPDWPLPHLLVCALDKQPRAVARRLREVGLAL